MFLHCPVVKSPEGVYVVSFRSRRDRGVQDCVERTHEAKVGAHYTDSMWVCMVPHLLVLMVFPVYFFSRSYISRKNDVAKSLVR
jgi:hypothetical protein